MEIDRKLLGASLIFGAIEGALANSSEYFAYLRLGTLPEYSWINMGLPYISGLINPVAIFIVFYYMGKGRDLPGKIGTTILSMVAGFVMGYTLAYVAVALVCDSIISHPIAYSLLASAKGFVMSIPSVISFFFVAFTALAIEHFTRSKGATTSVAVATSVQASRTWALSCSENTRHEH